MNIKKVGLVGGMFALVNFDNVTEIHERTPGSCDIYFNTMSTSHGQSLIKVKGSMSEIELLINQVSSE